MVTEKILEIYTQLQKLNSLDPEKYIIDKKTLNPVKQAYIEIIEKSLKSSEQTTSAVCQYNSEDKLKNIHGFTNSIFRMLQTGRLNKQGLEKIIATFKKHYQLEQ